MRGSSGGTLQPQSVCPTWATSNCKYSTVSSCFHDMALRMQRQGCMLDVVRHGPLSQDTEEGEEAGEVHPGPFQGGAIKAIKAHPEDDGVGAHDEGGADEVGADDAEGDAGSQGEEVPPPTKAAARVRKGTKRQVKSRRRGGRAPPLAGRRIKEYAAFRSSLDISPHLHRLLVLALMWTCGHRPEKCGTLVTCLIATATSWPWSQRRIRSGIAPLWSWPPVIRSAHPSG